MRKICTALAKRDGKNNKGFTLVELIVVIAILAVLAAILIPTVSGYIGKANDAAKRANAQSVYTAAQTAYVSIKAETGIAPTSTESVGFMDEVQSLLGSSTTIDLSEYTITFGENGIDSVSIDDYTYPESVSST